MTNMPFNDIRHCTKEAAVTFIVNPVKGFVE